MSKTREDKVLLPNAGVGEFFLSSFSPSFVILTIIYFYRVHQANITKSPRFSLRNRIDIQVGSLRLSYQDARLHMMRDNQHWIAKTNDRWKELLSEGPDLMVLGLEGHSNTPDDLRAYDLATSQIVEAAAATNFTGLIAVNPTKKRILNGGNKMHTSAHQEVFDRLLKMCASLFRKPLGGARFADTWTRTDSLCLMSF